MPAIAALGQGVGDGPASNEIRAKRCRAYDEQGAPVMADKVYRLTSGLHLRDEPANIGFLGTVKASRGG